MIDLFIDSGAYSAWSKGTKINLDGYISFLKENEKHITVYANLDVIGNQKATWKNQQIMEEAGLSPLPVYHIEDNIDYLHRCLEYDYFCLGGMAKGYNSEERKSFLDSCFDIICDTSDRLPKSKVHGFGLTSIKLMHRYPWYSVDSTTWVAIGRNGNIIVPKRKNGKYVYDENYLVIAVSEKSPELEKEGKHFDTMPESMQQTIMNYLDEKGFDIDDLRTDYKKRDQLNILYFLDFEKSMPEWPWPFEHKVNKGFGL